MCNIERFLVAPSTTIREAMACIDRNASGIVLVVADDRTLLGTVTDGDVRRAVLTGKDLRLPVAQLLDDRPQKSRKPIVGSEDVDENQLIHLMNANGIRHIPIVDQQGRAVRLVTLTDLVREYELPLTAVIMAGGEGRRLLPLTETVPKPMVNVGGRPLLERIIEQLREAGVRRVHITTHYKHDVIKNHFGDGSSFGINIAYTQEDQPLGTAGALRLLENSNELLLIINGDILTRVDFRAMMHFHRDQSADMTIAVSGHETQIPYGVVETNGVSVIGFQEKPVLHHFVNAGIYLATGEVCQQVPADGPCDMPDLIKRVLRKGKKVVSFPIREYWRDVGQMEEYINAAKDIVNGDY